MSREDDVRLEETIRITREKYRDIIDLPHPVSKKHPQMPMSDRAAQFAAFAALSGHSERIKESERLVEKMMQEETEDIDWI